MPTNQKYEVGYDKRSQIRLAFNEAFVPQERRMSARIEHHVATEFYAWENEGEGSPVNVTIEDFSVSGVGAVCGFPMCTGDEYLLRIPQPNRGNLSVILTVVRCNPLPDGEYCIGLRLSSVIDRAHLEKLAESIRDHRRRLTRRTVCLFALFGIVGISTGLLLC